MKNKNFSFTVIDKTSMSMAGKVYRISIDKGNKLNYLIHISLKHFF